MIEDENQISWNALAKIYLDKFGGENQYNQWIQSFCSKITMPQPKILDLGCGPGINAKKILEYCVNAQLTGIDFAPSMVETAREHVPDAYFQVGDIRNIPLHLQLFDGIFASFSIPYINAEEVEKMILECRSRLKRGGVLFISFIESSENHSKKVTNSAGLPMTMHYFDAVWLKSILTDLSFEILDSFQHFEPSYGNDSNRLCAFISRTSSRFLDPI